MKWILLVFLLISCQDEDMRLFQTGLSSGGSAPPPVIIDGGNLVALTPDLPLGEPTRGFTNTGLFYCKAESEARTDGILVFFSSNYGRLDWQTAGGRYESFVKVGIDYQAGGGLVGDRYTAELLENINTYKTQTGTSMQGIFQRDNGTVYVSDNGLRGYEPNADVNGDAVLVDDLSAFGIGPALAYDDTNETILKGAQQVITRYDFTGALLETLPIDLSGIGTNNIDHLSLNTDEDILMVTFGGNGLNYYRYSTLEFIKTEDLSGMAIDIEGCALVRSPYDNKLYVFINSDNWAHQDGNPDTDINAIHKVLSTVFD